VIWKLQAASSKQLHTPPWLRWIEQRIPNPEVAGSNPAGGANSVGCKLSLCFTCAVSGNMLIISVVEPVLSLSKDDSDGAKGETKLTVPSLPKTQSPYRHFRNDISFLVFFH
jgi:hypothetical protein